MVLPDGNDFTNGALLLGNGINRYQSSSDEDSWHDILRLIGQRVAGIPTFQSDRLLNDHKEVTYPDCFDLIQLRADADITAIHYRHTKPGICNHIASWMPKEHHSRVVQHCIDNDMPVLTTNFDTTLARAVPEILSDTRHRNKHKPKNRRSFPYHQSDIQEHLVDQYPWHAYYAPRRVTSASAEFAIWHIHGVHHYSRSLRLGLTDYMGLVHRAREWMHRRSGNPFNDRDRVSKWIGRNSWLEIFLMRPLCIIGLGLNAQETSLRWLLFERAKLYRKHPDLKQPLFFMSVREVDNVSEGKQQLLESLGATVLEYEYLDDLYVNAFQ